MNVDCTVSDTPACVRFDPRGESRTRTWYTLVWYSLQTLDIERAKVTYGLRQLSASAWKGSTADAYQFGTDIWIARVQLHGFNRSSSHDSRCGTQRDKMKLAVTI